MKNSSFKLELICYIPLVIKEINSETSEMLKKKLVACILSYHQRMTIIKCYLKF